VLLLSCSAAVGGIVDRGREQGYGVSETNMGMGKQKIKRIADFLEKLAVAGIALGIFQEKSSGMGLAIMFFVVSLMLTREVQHDN